MGSIDARLYCADCKDVLPDIAASSVTAIITDPPYSKKYLYLYEFIARQAKRILERGGSLLAIVPHYAMPQVYESVGEHLKYRWTHCMWQMDGAHPRMAMGIEIIWKPVVWWVNDAWPQGRGFVRDGFVNIPPSKDRHPWEQHLTWAEFCLKMVPDGGPVLDPLMGTGTVGVACAKSGHPFIGIESSEETFPIARDRIAETGSEIWEAK